MFWFSLCARERDAHCVRVILVVESLYSVWTSLWLCEPDSHCVSLCVHDICLCGCGRDFRCVCIRAQFSFSSLCVRAILVLCVCVCVRARARIFVFSLRGAVVGEGSGRHGYEVRRAGGGIGAGFPSVSLRSMLSPGTYLSYKKTHVCVCLRVRACGVRD